MSGKRFTIALVSDLHAHKAGDSGVVSSHLRVGEDESQPGRHPIGGLLKLIRDERLKADILLCPGDMGDKADPAGIVYVWEALHRVGEALKCRLVVGTTGNHDVDSRLIHHSFDPVEVLKSLTPPYPSSDSYLNGQYWMNYCFFHEDPLFRLLVINSSAYHAPGSDELQRGRIAERTLAHIRKYLQQGEVKDINICLCHHHPQQHSELKLGEYDWMRAGQELLDLFGSGLGGRWIVLHGHKHHPKLTYASGGAVSPVVFSAGSLSAALYAELATAARNQFYLLTLEVAKIQAFGLVGQGRAWDWATSKGWVKASNGSGLPGEFGFGYRTDPVVLGARVTEVIGKRELLAWQDLSNNLPEVSFVLPRDLEALNQRLENHHKLRIMFDDHGVPLQIGKIA